jgi:RNA polymerase subunit RPABC4/transcription elongation factor Spt4
MRMIAVMVDCEKREGAKAEGAKRPAARRACLACGQGFASAGPHERICGPCKDTEEWRDLAAAARGHILW